MPSRLEVRDDLVGVRLVLRFHQHFQCCLLGVNPAQALVMHLDDVAAALADALSQRIYDGTSEIMKEVIARALVGR